MENEHLTDGYNNEYEIQDILNRFATGIEDKQCWEEVWDDLHHQGDIGTASYATLIELVDIYKARERTFEIFSFASVIEECRNIAPNPQPPNFLNDRYQACREQLKLLAFEDITTKTSVPLLHSILSFLAGYSRSPATSNLIFQLDLWEHTQETCEYFGENWHD